MNTNRGTATRMNSSAFPSREVYATIRLPGPQSRNANIIPVLPNAKAMGSPSATRNMASPKMAIVAMPGETVTKLSFLLAYYDQDFPDKVG